MPVDTAFWFMLINLALCCFCNEIQFGYNIKETHFIEALLDYCDSDMMAQPMVTIHHIVWWGLIVISEI